MAGVKISQFPQVTSLNGGEYIPIVESGANKAISPLMINGGMYSVKWFGAKGDGVTDDTAAVQSAVDYIAANGGGLVIPEGTYKMNSAVMQTNFQYDCVIIGNGCCIFDVTGMGSAVAFDFGCTADVPEISIGANISKGDTDIITGITAERGDILRILSTDSWGGVPIGKREMVKVNQTSGGTLKIYNPAFDDYNSGTTTITNLNAKRLIIRNIRILGTTSVNQIGLTVRSFYDIEISHVELINMMTTGISCYYIFGGIISNCNISNNLRAGFGYGIYLGSCQGVKIWSCNLNGVRHGIAMGVCTKYCSVENNVVFAGEDFDYPIENHESCEYVLISNNFIFGGGIYLRGLNNNVLYNTIYVTKGGGAAIGVTLYGYTGRVNEYLNIIGNKVIPYGGIAEYALQVKFWSDDDHIERMNVKDNMFNVDNHAVYFHLDAGTETGNRVDELTFEGNMIETTGLNKVCIYLNENVLYGNIFISNCQLKTLNGGTGILVNQNAAGGNLYVDSCMVNVSSYPIRLSTGSLENVFIRNCHLKGGQYLDLLASQDVILQNNYLDSMIKDGIKVNAGTAVYTHGGNVKFNCAGVVEDAAGITNDGGDF